MLASLGWSVVHSLWLSTLVAGLLAVVVSCLGDARARTRYTLSYVALIAMVMAPIVMAFTLLDPFTPAARQQVTTVVDAAIGFSSYVSWRAIVVRAAAGIWIVGVAVAAVRFIAEWRQVARLRPSHAARVDEALTVDVDGLAAAMGVRQDVAVFRTRLAHVPMVFGLRTPTILLPDTTAAVLNPSQVRAILAHELAHVGRKDYLANLVQIGLETLLWFHPAARWVGRRIRTEREYCCDDLAVRVAPRPADYARALAELDDARDGGRLVVAAASGTLLDRVQRIVGEPRPVLTPGRGSFMFVLALLIAAVVVSGAMVLPPQVELDAQLRQRSPAPPGTTITPDGPTFPRTAR
jgi:bla regulator protein BlaR1